MNDYNRATLRNLLAKCECYPPDDVAGRAELLPDIGLFDDGLGELRRRVAGGEDLAVVVRELLARWREEDEDAR